jgi:hypothetical protein
MKSTLLTLLLLVITFASYAQNISGRFSSSVYTFERFDSLETSTTYARAYQLLSLIVSQDKVSLRSSMNLETNLKKEQQVDHPRLRFYNLYLEARDLFDIATLKFGRQPQFNSVIGGVFDGINLDLHKGDYKLSGFYGANVPAYQKFEIIDDWGDNYVLGASFRMNFLTNFRFEARYANKNFKQQEFEAIRYSDDELMNPIQVLIRNKSNQYEFVTGELSYSLKKMISVDTKYEYDLNFNETSRVEVFGRYEQVEDLGINVYYNYREPRVRYNSIFSVFDFGNSQEIEVGGDYRLNPNYTVIAKFANVTYETENSQRITAGLNTSWGTLSYRKNLGYAGELDAVSVYSAYSLIEGLITPSLGLSYTTYKLSESAEKNNLVTVLAGVNYRPFKVFSVDLQGQYMNNKIYKDDYRFFLKLNYWFNTNLNLM